VEKIILHTSHHTHTIIGSGSGDPQKYDPGASRETLDHSLMYILTVALEDGCWHHMKSYTKERANRPSTVDLWRRVSTAEDEDWTRRYHEPDPAKRAYGGKLVITMKDGSVIEDAIAAADAHPSGAAPFRRNDYIGKFRALAEGLATPQEIARFMDIAFAVPSLAAGGLSRLNIQVADSLREPVEPLLPGLFERAFA
jgi:2-methylcitrate dehydratase